MIFLNDFPPAALKEYLSSSLNILIDHNNHNDQRSFYL